MAANSQQFGTRLHIPSKNVNEVNIFSLEQQIVILTCLVHQMVVGNTQTAKACRICSVVRHPTDMCPTLQEEPTEQVNAAGGFPGQPQRKYDPYLNTYNMGLRDHPNLSYENPQLISPRLKITQVTSNITRQQSGQTSTSGTSLEDIVKSLASNTSQFQQETKQFQQEALVDSRNYEQNKDLYETFCRCDVNIPLLDAIKQEPHYAKFLKELCIIKRKLKLKGCEKVRVGENVSVVIQRKFPVKCKDPGMFTIPCTLGNTRFEKAIIDLGASINAMPYSIYDSLKLGPLNNKTGVVIQLADISNAYPKGVVADVLVQVNDLIFPTDFYVLDMKKGDQTAPILLGRPFSKTTKTKIDVHSGTLTMEFDIEIVECNIYDAMK
ncbi:uncharacterized protein [Aristolochia californica]|uniref:uncharacterized protein n=1 Tax=Aristolochia californica TaxID=171875 RepID=UPI0035D6EA40